MTSSEREAPPPAPAAPAAPARVIAAGYLHPGMLFLRMLDGARQAIPLGVIGLLTQQLWLLVATGVFFVLALVYALARYLTFEYRLTEEELITTEGILHRQERRIPVNRIQDLSFESTLMRRLVGLVVVSVETASSQGSEAKLDSLSRRDAERLREALYLTRASRGLTATSPEVLPAEQVLYRVNAGELFLRGLTINRIGVILAALFALYELASELGLGERVGGALTGWVANLPTVVAATVLVSIVFIALVGGWVVSVIATFVMFWGFTLTVRDQVFQRRYGLITTRAASLPRRKIQRVLVEQSVLRRLFRVAVMRADSAGSGMDPQEELRGGRDIVMPLADLPRVLALVPLLLPGLELAALLWQRVSIRVITRIFLKGVVFAVMLTALAAVSAPWLVLVALALLPIAYAVGVLSYHNLGYAEVEGHLGLRWGILGRYRAMIPLRKVQGIVLRASPIDRMLSLRQLTVYVAGGSPTTLRHLPRVEAQQLQDRLARAAAAAPFVW